MREFSGTSRYEPRRRIGAGTAGVVYEVWDHERGRRAALKLLRQSDSASLYRFKKEFRALAHVRHPHLARLYELEHVDGQWLVTMELVEGVDFVRHARAPDLEGNVATVEARLRPAARQLASGLRALHAAGRLHRDVKPSNVLVTGEGRVVLLDFGLVTEAPALQTYESFSEDLLGTPAYMAPEQGQGVDLTEAADWYGVGALLYEALTGQPPFAGQFVVTMLEKLRRDPPPPRELEPGISADLDALCRDLLRRDPAARPSGVEVAARLGAEDHAGYEIQPPPLVADRGDELAVLWNAFERTRCGEAATIGIRGPEGAGKSALARHFVAELRRRHPDAVTLTGRCYEHESLPYKALDEVIDKLTRYLRSLDAEKTAPLLPLDVGLLARRFPVLRRVDAVAAAPRREPAPAAGELDRRAAAALREVLTRLAEDQPLVIVIDDLQWGDAESAALLGTVLRPPDPPPMCLVLAYHDATDPGPFIHELRVGEIPFERLTMAPVRDSRPGAGRDEGSPLESMDPGSCRSGTR